jgi:hypothetical protein
MTFNYLPLSSKNAVHPHNRFSTPVSGGLAKISAVADTIKVTANGYKEQAIAKDDGQVVWEMRMPREQGADYGIYRAERVYPLPLVRPIGE